MKLSDLVTEQPKSLKLSDLQSGPEDIPEVSSQDFETAAGGFGTHSIKQGLADFFGSPKDQLAQALAVPGAKQSEDAQGNPIVELPGGKRFYINKPGASTMDAVGVIGKIGEFAPASRFATGVTKGASLLGRAVGQGLGAAGSEALTEKAFGNVDPSQVMLAGAMGGGGELLSPVIGASASKVKNIFSPDSAATVASRELAAGASPEALAAQQQYGLKLTQGQKTGDFSQLAKEEAMKGSPGNAGGSLLRDAQTQNTQALQNAYSELVGKVSGGQNTGSVTDAIEGVRGAVQSNAAGLKGAVKDAYTAANTKDAFVTGQPLADLQARAVGAVNLVDEQLTPATVRALKDIGDTARTGALRLDQADVLRQRLSALIRAGANPTDIANVTKVKGALDGWLDDAMDNALIQGDQTALQSLKGARALRAEYGAKFQAQDKGGKLVQQMLQDGKSPEELANLALGAQQVSNAASGSVARSVKAALTDSNGQLNQEAWDQFRGSVLLKLGQAKTGEQVGLQQLSSNIKTLLNQRPTLVTELYSKQEQSALGSLTNAVGTVLPKGDFARSSGTAERALRYLSSSTPFIGKILGLAKSPIDYAKGVNALSPMAPAAQTPAPYLLPAFGPSNQ